MVFHTVRSGEFPLLAIIAMATVILASNILVMYPVNDWLVWGAVTYPVAFLVTDLTNRLRGPRMARRVVYTGFAVGVMASLLLAEVRVAMASGTAFLTAQLLDVNVFDRLRHRRWWIAPLVSSMLCTVLDTLLFFSLAMAGSGLPWMQYAAGDLAVKWLVSLLSLVPYGALLHWRASRQSVAL